MENIIDTRIRIPSINYNINLLNFFFETIVCEHYDRVNNLYWYPNHLIINMLVNFCKQHNLSNIIEIGPGLSPFPLATTFIGKNEKNINYIDLDLDLDLDTNKIPFDDNHFDFVYCRHVLEDIQNPDFLLNELLRTSKNGYIEMPSPLVELTKGVDAIINISMHYIGYMHHRYIVWSDLEENTIYFFPKYGFLENLFKIDPVYQQQIYDILNNYPVYWNTYYVWTSTTNKPKIVMYKNGVTMNDMLNDVIKIITSAFETTIKSTNYFIKNYSHFIS
jgi:ubiquinone/menaquinone biosynthesis C-methylase UbiE